jgi:hypothetical protein
MTVMAAAVVATLEVSHATLVIYNPCSPHIRLMVQLGVLQEQRCLADSAFSREFRPQEAATRRTTRNPENGKQTLRSSSVMKEPWKSLNRHGIRATVAEGASCR